jgi:dipicolinate synthase subunit A
MDMGKKILVEKSDKRNAILLELLGAGEFSFEQAQRADVLVFSPARRLSAEESAQLPQDALIIDGKHLMKSEEFAVRNALLTAEAALALTIGGTDKSVFENNILILGCGRVGKAVALLLKRLGVSAAIATYDKGEADSASLYADTIYFGEQFKARLSEYDVVINTVPALLLEEADLQTLGTGTLIIELASVPCLDTAKLDKYQFEYFSAQGLPAKYSAESAAKLMYARVKEILEEKNR